MVGLALYATIALLILVKLFWIIYAEWSRHRLASRLMDIEREIQDES